MVGNGCSICAVTHRVLEQLELGLLLLPSCQLFWARHFTVVSGWSWGATCGNHRRWVWSSKRPVSNGKHTLKHTSFSLHITVMDQYESDTRHKSRKLISYWDHILSDKLVFYYVSSTSLAVTREDACWGTALPYWAVGTVALTEHTDHIWVWHSTSYTCLLSRFYLSSGDRQILLSFPFPSSSVPAPYSWADWRLLMFHVLSLRLEGTEG